MNMDVIAFDGGARIDAFFTVVFDVTPPHPEMTLTGQSYAPGWYSSDVGIIFDVDTESWQGITPVGYYALDTDGCSPTALENCIQIPGITYRFNVSTEGEHTLTYFATQSNGIDSPVQTIHFGINKTGPAPQPQSLTLNEGQSLTITLTAVDPGHQSLTYAIRTAPAHGDIGLAIANGVYYTPIPGNQVTYTPDPNYFGPDSFTFMVNDDHFESNPLSQTISLTIQPVDDAPVANPQQLTTDINHPLPLTLTGSDVEGDSLSYSVVTPPSHGALTGTPPDLTYTPETGYFGNDSFTFQASDGTLNSDPATVSLFVRLPLLTISSATIAPEESVVLSISTTEAVPNAAGLDLALQPNAPEGAPVLSPTFSLGDDASDWQALSGFEGTWHATLLNSTGVEGPAQLLRLKLTAPSNAVIGSVYHLQAASAILSNESGQDQDITSQVVPADVTVVACSEREKGDVNGDGAIGIGDVILALRMFVHLTTGNSCMAAAADINCDGSVGLGDAVQVLRSVALHVPIESCQ
jgi:hypothetical protein